MKIICIGDKKRTLKYLPKTVDLKQFEMIYLPRDYQLKDLLAHKDAEFILTDPMAHFFEEDIKQFVNLKCIHSEGVGYNSIPVELAKKMNIYVCNCKGANAMPVAEQTVLLILSLLRNIVVGHQAVLDGHQMLVKETLMIDGIKEVADCTVGLVGLGDIGKKTAMILNVLGAKVIYYDITKNDESLESLGIEYMPLDELISNSDIISLHVPVTQSTIKMVNKDFIAKMKDKSYIVNTARGEIIDNEALYEAICSGKIAGVGLDTVAPEPVTKDNILLNLPEQYQSKIIFSPHIGGITESFFYRSHQIMWSNIDKIRAGFKPENIVNDL